MECQFERNKDGYWECGVCGYIYKHNSKPKRLCKSLGLGDTVRKVTAFFGVPHCKSCGRRQKWLNKVVPYKQTKNKP